ncbi:MAG: VCBS repeat-containing protein [Polyangiaceae bacterium]|nr:VCBS repeat-containing protein [Polyangiaceae bacterium]
MGTLYTKRALTIWRHDPGSPQGFQFVRKSVDVNGAFSTAKCQPGLGKNSGGGPVTVGDFDGDGTPDVGLAGAVTYSVFDGKKLMNAAVADGATFLWQKETQDCTSSATGSSLFDFEGDGKVEVVYSDEVALRVYDGATGAFKWETCNTSATASENPVIVDIDNDGQADILAVSNAGFYQFYPNISCSSGSSLTTSGLRVWSSKNGGWARTRSVWNQHSYHITNVSETGEIPKNEPENWLQPGLNNFRQNRQPTSALGLPDGVITLLAPACEGGTISGLIARVYNVGEALLPAGVTVSFYAGDPGVKLGTQVTSKVLLPLQYEDLLLPLPSAPADVVSGDTPVRAVFDEGGEPHPSWTECNTGNNSSSPVAVSCGKL